jgi:large subunit ribosomal protein L10
MNRTEKTAEIEKVKANFDKAISVALVDFQGLTVETVTALRREFRKAGVEYKVVKNTLIRHALKDSPYQQLVGDLSPDRKNAPKAHAAVRGMTGVAWSYTDPSAPAKVIETFKKAQADKAAKLSVKTGLVGGDLIAGDKLAKMPGLKETQAMIVGQLTGPSVHLYASLVMPGAYLVALLEAHVENLKKAEGGA